MLTHKNPSEDEAKENASRFSRFTLSPLSVSVVPLCEWSHCMRHEEKKKKIPKSKQLTITATLPPSRPLEQVTLHTLNISIDYSIFPNTIDAFE